MKIYAERFDSITAFAAHLAPHTGREGKYGNSSEETRATSWALGMDWSQALTMAKRGGDWPEGAAELQSIDTAAATKDMATMIAPELVNDVVGGAIDVPEYLIGAPECFLRMDEEAEQPRSMIRLAACVGATADTSGHHMLNRGRAILAAVDAYELQGYTVELTAFMVCHRKGRMLYTAEIVLKQAGIPWDSSSVAFGLAHPAFSRRLGFKALEIHPDAAWLSAESYGNGNMEKPEGFDIYFNYVTSGRGFTSPDEAIDTVKRTIREQTDTQL